MNFRNISEQGARNIATTIRTATYNVDRNMMERLDYQYGGLRRICRALMVTGFMTRDEARAAIHTLPRINNPSCRG